LLLFLAVIGWIFGTGAASVMFVIFLAAGGFGARFLKEYVLYLFPRTEAEGRRTLEGNRPSRCPGMTPRFLVSARSEPGIGWR
jgi:hypothetical protein